ncbi:MAG: hypothetical protein V2J55_19945 [Candidatus Competibacteraceae bacterium]|jgi:hypothetical protein|nr:hypothetical protein [Candidatus Competibacteraceae bacterium]
MSYAFECLDTSDSLQVADYERAFYAAFFKVTSNRLIRSLWLWDETEQRLSTRIAYQDQLIVVGRNATGMIETAIATNIACREWQAAAFDFSLPRDQRCCEFLTFFTVTDHRLNYKLRFWQACFAELRQRGLEIAYGTTAARLLKLYQRIGGVVLEQREIEREMRYFLKFSLERTWMKRLSE